MAVRQLGVALAAATACLFSLAEPAWACGDKLVALGGGVGFERIMVSRNPGHIVLLLEPGSGLAAANDKFNLAASLSLAGHEVVIAKSTDELRGKQNSAPDLIMVDASRASAVESSQAAGASAPVVMPIEYFADGSTVPASYKSPSCVTTADGRKGSTVLKAVERTLKLRSRGQSVPCPSNGSGQNT